MISLKGHFLIASPHLADENFYRSVVLMIQHDEQGALGVILNRPTDKSVAEMWELMEEGPCDDRQPVHVGGPVAGPLIAIHTDPECAESEVVPGVYFSSTKPLLTQLIQESSQQYRLFLGYAGWAGGQLEGEMEAGGWLTLPARRDDIFSPQEDLWKRVSRQVGLDILAPTIKRHTVPDDPSVN